MSLLLSCLILSAAVFAGGCLSNTPTSDTEMDMIPFGSEKEMQTYFETVYQPDYSYRSGISISGEAQPVPETANPSPRPPSDSSATPTTPAMPNVPASPEAPADGSGSIDRVSETNVQVAGVDEADLVKTDGNTIYYTPQNYYVYNLTAVNDSYGGMYYNYETYPSTFVIDALPPETAAVLSNIGMTGELYLINNTLVAVSYQDISAYNVTNPAAPVMIWHQDLDGYYVESRLIDGKLYLVAQNYSAVYPVIYMGNPIPYTDYYHPVGPVTTRPATDSTYFVSQINVGNGTFEKTIALIGSPSSTVVYSSLDNLYLTNYYYPDETAISMKFITEYGNDYFPSDIMAKIGRIVDNPDLSENVKYTAVSETIYDYMNTLSSEERSNLYNEYDQAYSIYLEEYIKNSESTLISKINLTNFTVITGTVPGLINNQFSMDEYDSNLRVATTVGNYWRLSDDRSSGVYVLDEKMKTIGNLSGLAPGERIYSARFVDDRLYMVTYKQVDPFFVIDVSNPNKPSVLGELKLPGYSTYLQPINDTLVLGLGYTDNGQMKLSLFDVTNVSAPIELSSYVFTNTYGSEALYDHHAFLWDPEYNVLVLPTYEHAYIMEIKNNNISMKKDDVHKESSVIRSIYINNYLYTFSNKEVHILDQNTWDLVKVISIPQPTYPYSSYPYPYYGKPVPDMPANTPTTAASPPPVSAVPVK
ncbi:beta-propeller domain-containing protein [Methanolapillus ohkumae]